jgi:hypothetical protein
MRLPRNQLHHLVASELGIACANEKIAGQKSGKNPFHIRSGNYLNSVRTQRPIVQA